ncbi:class I SAM-dependent methyltransferase [Nitrospira moscoviensis]|uniref:Putative methyltransferase n=1 Tax=Nitrospira moscoviensis TaxID=42253 RepID=A0A0K2GFP3_NITMO|nr:class I SAM-dependent methyltransferase [Nitrospira moscoviensis]ALA59783.1 putative methyltransferase [Nitrospira moscoviensis]
MTERSAPVADPHASHERFFDYYAAASQSKETAERFESIRDVALRLYRTANPAAPAVLDVADVGCGAGAQSIIWSRLGHRVHGVDINEPLLNLGRERAGREGLTIDFRVGTATALPWETGSMDICLVPELLEHVAEWRPCVTEVARVLRRGGLLFLSTTNRLCPKQQEFSLPFYSWYPGRLKRYCERLAVTTHPQFVNYAKYPAVNWFSFYQLRDELKGLGFHSMDRFDVIDTSKRTPILKGLVSCVRQFPLLRWLGHVATPSLLLFAVKSGR